MIHVLVLLSKMFKLATPLIPVSLFGNCEGNSSYPTPQKRPVASESLQKFMVSQINVEVTSEVVF